MKKLKMKEIITEGMIKAAIGGILKAIYSGKIKQLKKDVEPLSKELAQNLEDLNNSIKVLNKSLRDPKRIEALKLAGIDPTSHPYYRK